MNKYMEQFNFDNEEQMEKEMKNFIQNTKKHLKNYIQYQKYYQNHC